MEHNHEFLIKSHGINEGRVSVYGGEYLWKILDFIMIISDTHVDVKRINTIKLMVRTNVGNAMPLKCMKMKKQRDI